MKRFTGAEGERNNPLPVPILRVLPRGFEPLTLAGHGPKPCAYASSATGALPSLNQKPPKLESSEVFMFQAD